MQQTEEAHTNINGILFGDERSVGMDSNVSKGGNHRQRKERRGQSQLHDVCTLYEYKCVKNGILAWMG